MYIHKQYLSGNEEWQKCIYTVPKLAIDASATFAVEFFQSFRGCFKVSLQIELCLEAGKFVVSARKPAVNNIIQLKDTRMKP